MNTTTLPVEIGPEEVELVIGYNIYGKDLPATWHHPAEYAELEVESVKVKCKGLHQPLEIPVWLSNLLSDDIEQACWDHAEDMARQAREDWAA